MSLLEIVLESRFFWIGLCVAFPLVCGYVMDDR
jgi:hypothetical protein